MSLVIDTISAEPVSWEQLGMHDAPLYRAAFRIPVANVTALRDVPEIFKDYKRLYGELREADIDQLFILTPARKAKAKVLVNPERPMTRGEYAELMNAISLWGNIYSRQNYEPDPANPRFLRSRELVRMISPDDDVAHVILPDGTVHFRPMYRLVCQEVLNPTHIWFPTPRAFYNRYGPG
jgi:hypothetical protein